MSEPSAKPPVSSSLPPDFPQKQEALFRESLLLMNRCSVPYTVAGAFALHQHTGIWRCTKDLDLFLCAQDIPQALHCFERGGFVGEICDPVWLAKAHRDGFFVDLITGMSNAIIVVDRTWMDRSSPCVVLGVETRVLAAEELLASKLFVIRRERFDGADIAHIIYGTQGKLDWERILFLAGDHWEILLWALILYRYIYPAQTGYVPNYIWKKLLTQFQSELDNPNPKAPFRGSLIDDNMFAIDVAEWGMDDILWRQRQERQDQIASSENQEPPR
jgi:hypothetical protein